MEREIRREFILLDLVYRPSLMIAGEEDDFEKRALMRQENQQRLMEFIEESKQLEYRYLLYEPDVWINAFFSVRYSEIHRVHEDDKYIDKNGGDMERFCFPFAFYERDDFGKECRKLLYNKNNQEIFGTQYKIEVIEGWNDLDSDYQKINKEKGSVVFLNNISGIIKKIEVRYPYDMNFTRWSYNKMMGLEEKVQDLELEDKILFYFVLNPMYVRNIMGFWVNNDAVKGMDEYRELLYKSNQLKSFAWQNYISILFMGVFGEFYQTFTEVDVDILNGWQAVFKSWCNRREEINKKLKLLTAALIYMRKPEDDVVIKEKSEYYLKNLEYENIELSEEIKREMEMLTEKKHDKIKLRVSKENRGCIWEYAFLQMETIHAKTYYNVQRIKKVKECD